MTRARILPEGVTAPIDKGRSIQERMKRTSSSSRMPRFSSNCLICCSIFLPMPSRFCSNRRIWCSILRSMMVFLNSRRRSCRPIFCSNFCRVGSGMRVTQKSCTRQNLAGFKTFAGQKPYAGDPELSARICAAGQTVEELLDLAEESGRFRLRFDRRKVVEFNQQLALLLGQLLRRLDHDLDIHVAELPRAQDRHALALQAEPPAGMRAFGNFHF